MDIIPIDPESELNDIFKSIHSFPFSLKEIKNPGDYENESIVFIATEDIESLDEYILVYSVENPETGIPDYSKCRLLTFDTIELQKDSLLEICTRPGEDKTSIGFETSSLNYTTHWGLPAAIWNVPLVSFELIKRRESYSGGLNI